MVGRESHRIASHRIAHRIELNQLVDHVSSFAAADAIEMSSAANSFLRLNSTVSQPGSPTSCKSDKQSPLSQIGGAASSVAASKWSGGGACGRFLRANPRFKKALAHIGLVILLGCYTAAGAAVNQIQIKFLFYSICCRSVAQIQSSAPIRLSIGSQNTREVGLNAHWAHRSILK